MTTSPLLDGPAFFTKLVLDSLIVAVGRWVTFAALALHQFPEHRDHVQADSVYRGLFAQKVRRFYPFFPAVAARTRRAFTWNGLDFPGGTRAILDLYATCNDPRLFAESDRFDPARFEGVAIGRYALVPQGGGDQFAGHRCAGEWATLALVNLALELLTNRVTYSVPPQDLFVARDRLPAVPRSGFVMSGIRGASAGRP